MDIILENVKVSCSIIRPVLTSHYCSGPVFVNGNLLKASHVFLKSDGTRKSLEPPYGGPCKVLSRTSNLWRSMVDHLPYRSTGYHQRMCFRMKLLPGSLLQFLRVEPRSLNRHSKWKTFP
ncbi:hypothetical protein AVEN_43292-1 [Araneus ventricosus]|uniref:Uncharacterized protein n=1 Tax=Araneus ventricosus TaxID=182803 RepID=A0A4Y2GDJ8_ARAVE|nr:hypothetical protein AVEN_43292-1 [Araneus ventricosus]